MHHHHSHNGRFHAVTTVPSIRPLPLLDHQGLEVPSTRSPPPNHSTRTNGLVHTAAAVTHMHISLGPSTHFQPPTLDNPPPSVPSVTLQATPAKIGEAQHDAAKLPRVYPRRGPVVKLEVIHARHSPGRLSSSRRV